MISHRRLLAALAAFATGAVLGVGVPGAASARNEPISTHPALDSRVDVQPDAVTMAFTKPVGDPVYLVVEDSKGAQVVTGTPRVVSTSVSIRLAGDLPDGVYTVRYRVEGDNGPEGGSYQFGIGGAGSFSITGIEQWGGFKEIPEPLALPGDKESAAAAEGATPTAPPPTTSTPSDGPSSTASADAGHDNQAVSAEDHNSSPWWWLIAAIVVVGLGGGAAVLYRRRSSTEDAPRG